MRPALLLLVLLLAGCADEPPPLVAGEPVYGDAEVPTGPGLAPLVWTTAAEGSHALAPANGIAASVDVPLHTVGVYVNLTLEQGAFHGIDVALGECLWSRDVALAAPQEFAADCGGILDGANDLFVTIDAGATLVGWRVVALTCDPAQGRCPPRLPVSGA